MPVEVCSAKKTDLLQFHISVFDPAGLPERDGNERSQDGGEYKADQDQTDPVHSGDGGLGAVC